MKAFNIIHSDVNSNEHSPSILLVGNEDTS
jgi:hypothetical protein